MLIAAGVFGAVLAIIVGAYWTFVIRPEQQEEQAVKRRLQAPRRTTGTTTAKFVKDPERMSALGALDHLLASLPNLADPIRRLIVRSESSLTVGAVLLASAFLAIVAAAVVLQVAAGAWVFGAALAAGFAAAWLPILYLRMKANRRLMKFEEQFPEAIDLMARALRAGHALNTALQMVGEEVPDPVGGEFRLLFEQQNYGMSMTEALRAFADRIPVLDARFFTTALLTQRESGGNLSEILDNLSSVIRERFKVKRQVRVISAHGRMTGWVLGLLPPAIGGILLVISPTHIRLLIDDPIGLYILGGAIVLQIVGVLAIRHIVNVEY